MKFIIKSLCGRNMLYFNNFHFILNIIRKTYNKIGGWNYKMDILTLMKINTIRCGVVYECILPIYIFHVIYDTNSICLLLDTTDMKENGISTSLTISFLGMNCKFFNIMINDFEY